MRTTIPTTRSTTTSFAICTSTANPKKRNLPKPESDGAHRTNIPQCRRVNWYRDLPINCNTIHELIDSFTLTRQNQHRYLGCVHNKTKQKREINILCCEPLIFSLSHSSSSTHFCSSFFAAIIYFCFFKVANAGRFGLHRFGQRGKTRSIEERMVIASTKRSYRTLPLLIRGWNPARSCTCRLAFPMQRVQKHQMRRRSMVVPTTVVRTTKMMKFPAMLP